MVDRSGERGGIGGGVAEDVHNGGGEVDITGENKSTTLELGGKGEYTSFEIVLKCFDIHVEFQVVSVVCCLYLLGKPSLIIKSYLEDKTAVSEEVEVGRSDGYGAVNLAFDEGVVGAGC